MDLKGVWAFCSMADGGSFSRTAAADGAAQSVFSRQVFALEQSTWLAVCTHRSLPPLRPEPWCIWRARSCAAVRGR